MSQSCVTQNEKPCTHAAERSATDSSFFTVSELPLIFSKIEQRERGNVLTHGIATLLSLPVLAVLTTLSMYKNKFVFAGCVLYGMLLFATFSVSTMYHAAPTGPCKHALRVLDHLLIYIMIAGTLLAIAMVIPEASVNSVCLYLGAAFVVAGFGVKWRLWINRWTWRCELIGVLLYVLLGMLGFPILGVDALLGGRGLPGLLIGVGAGCYLIGVVFYIAEDRGRCRLGHEIWHVCAALGAIVHAGAFGVVAWS